MQGSIYLNYRWYGYDKRFDNPYPIIDSAYVLLDFIPSVIGTSKSRVDSRQGIIGCLELCMFADGSRQQEEIIVTGMEGRLEAYLPENKVFHYQIPKGCSWKDWSQPPPKDQ